MTGKKRPRDPGGESHGGKTESGKLSSSSLPLAASCVNDPFVAACGWLELGVSLVPLQPRSKHLLAGYGAHSKTVTTEEEAARWFRDRACNLGLVTGVPLVVLDFDDLPVYVKWASDYQDLAKTLTVITSRGRHAYFVTDRLLPSVRLAEGVELKGDGSVVTAVPSVHPSGHVYRWFDDNAPLLELPITSSFLNGILAHTPVVAQPPVIEGSDTVARIKRAWPILEIAQQMTRLKATAGQDRWLHGRCPFHDDAHQSFWIDTARGLYGCRSCSAKGDTINLFARWRGLDLQEAIKAMIEARP